MWFFGKFTAILTGLAVAAATNPQQPLSSATASFPVNGPISIRGIVKQDGYPSLLFRSLQTHQELLNAQLGKGEYWKESVPKGYTPDMEIRFLILHRTGLPDPLIVAMAKRYGGSDCGFEPALFGEVGGRLSALTPPLPDHFLRGGLFLSAANGNGPITLTVTSERYQWGKDVHYTGPSRMTVFVYTYDSSQGRFVETQQTEVNTDDLKVLGESLTAIFGEFAHC
jgi:hypothetical protein